MQGIAGIKQSKKTVIDVCKTSFLQQMFELNRRAARERKTSHAVVSTGEIAVFTSRFPILNNPTEALPNVFERRIMGS